MKNALAKRGQKISLRIDRLSIGGRGVGRHDNLVIFVPDTAPDELVEVELTQVKKSFAEARLIRVLKPSPSRVEPPCPVAGICGGCNWQHISYEEQLRQKRQLVFEALRKFSGHLLPSVEAIEPVIPSPKPLRYRNRIQVHYSGSQFGFHKRGSHDIVDIDDCLITEESLTHEFQRLRVETSHLNAGRLELFLSESRKVLTRTPAAPTSASEATRDLESEISFSQVNTEQNAQLIDFVLLLLRQGVAHHKSSRIFDLYAGNGNFTFPISDLLPTTPVISVELNQSSVAWAKKRQSELSPMQPIQVFQGDVASFLQDSTHDLPDEHDFVLLDPPRVGCDPDVCVAIRSRKPKMIIYVSCHPVTLSRDIKLLGPEYELTKVQPFDMFPQTDHVEVVALLRRKTQ